jgi:hypothetical protein
MQTTHASQSVSSSPLELRDRTCSQTMVEIMAVLDFGCNLRRHVSQLRTHPKLHVSLMTEAKLL